MILRDREGSSRQANPMRYYAGSDVAGTNFHRFEAHTKGKRMKPASGTHPTAGCMLAYVVASTCSGNNPGTPAKGVDR